MNELMPVNLLILILVLIGIIILQIYLSKQGDKWLGLVLPAINVLFSIIAVLGMTFYANESFGQIILMTLYVLFIYNIPTLILLAIYFACREKRKKKLKR